MKTVFINGSPKKKLSVSSYLPRIVRLLVRGEVVTEQVRNAGDHERILRSIKDADAFFVIISVFQGGIFRGWLSRK